MCRSRMAQELLTSFGRGFKITTAGVAEGNAVPDAVCRVMQQKGYEISRKKPTHLSVYTNRKWDFVVALSKEAADEINQVGLEAEHTAMLIFDDPLDDMSLSEDEKELQIATLYQDMYKTLYEFYRDVLSELTMPRCTCGANTYCRCE